MRRTLLLTGALLAAPLAAAAAQTVRWNDRYASTWEDQAPEVRVAIVGDRNVGFLEPVQVRFEVSEDAYVTVVRVADDGRMQILFPTARGARSASRGGQLHYVRNARLGYNASFVATDRMRGGYVFALASFVPLDLSSFESRDFERYGGFSRFTQVNRSHAYRPDEFIERFAAEVLWDPSTPYDVDVDYYFMGGGPLNTASAYALCGAVSRHGYGPVYPRSALYYDWATWDLFTMPYTMRCASYWSDVRCLSIVTTFGSPTCFLRPIVTVVNPPRTDPVPGDPTFVPNEGVVRGGLLTPTPVPVAVNPGDEDPPPLERRTPRFDEVLRTTGQPDWDTYRSIPASAARKLKGESGTKAGATSREEDSRTGPVARSNTFDRAVEGSRVKEPSRVADVSAQPPARVQPSRPAKSKPNSEPRGATGRTTSGGNSADRSRGGSSSTGGISRPVGSSTTGSTPAPRPAPTVQSTGSGTTKTKPPSERQ
jgi:hypothetical protein